jgi:hypothetical protein
MNSLDRYLLAIFPLSMVAADWLTRHRLLPPAVGLSTMLACLYSVEFVRRRSCRERTMRGRDSRAWPGRHTLFEPTRGAR